jgi:hypothetical protein
MGENNENSSEFVSSNSQRVPPGISPYFVGLAFMLTTFITGFTGAWVAISGDVRQYMANQKEIRLQEILHESGQLAVKDDTIRLLRSDISELRAKLADAESRLPCPIPRK